MQLHQDPGAMKYATCKPQRNAKARGSDPGNPHYMAASGQRCLDPVQDLFCFPPFLPQGNAMPRDCQRSSRNKDDAKDRHLDD